eukprot:scaffold91958_cov18-Tisochrysis_lutea.AAC.1
MLASQSNSGKSWAVRWLTHEHMRLQLFVTRKGTRPFCDAESDDNSSGTIVAADVAALDAEEFAEIEAVEEAKAKAKEKEYLEALVCCTCTACFVVPWRCLGRHQDDNARLHAQQAFHSPCTPCVDAAKRALADLQAEAAAAQQAKDAAHAKEAKGGRSEELEDEVSCALMDIKIIVTLRHEAHQPCHLERPCSIREEHLLQVKEAVLLSVLHQTG